MKIAEFNNLKPGDLIIYKGSTNKATNRQTCKGLVLIVDHYEKDEGYICEQPYIKAGFRHIAKAAKDYDLYQI